jgi:hypothetical protein
MVCDLPAVQLSMKLNPSVVMLGVSTASRLAGSGGSVPTKYSCKFVPAVAIPSPPA